MHPLPLHCIIFLLLISWPFSLVFFCASTSMLAPGMTLTPGKNLISDQGTFALGFFSPSNSTEMMYVGIWFNNIPQCTVVWVANRDSPITHASSAKLSMANNSVLVLSETDSHILWMAANTYVSRNSSAKLLNNGNLVVLSSNGAMLWQSFENPSDAILAGMPVQLSHKTHPSERIVSWKSPEDPSRGSFSAGSDPDTPLQFFLWNGSVPYWRATVWGGYVVSNVDLQSVSSLMYLTISNGIDGETYSTFGLSDGSSGVWYKVDYSGQAIPTCKCLDGFDHNDKAEWARANFSQGCQRKSALQCGGGDGFLTLPVMKVPDKFFRVWNRSFDECAEQCSSNCSCVAYAYANLSTSNMDGDATRCLMWTGPLIDVEKGGVGNENLYLRLAGLSRKQENKENQKRMMIGDTDTSDELKHDHHELPFINFEEIVTATNNFSISNLLGKGGFGKVYKGILHGSIEVAVKRLSRGSGQGMREFKNEVVLIAQLQHKNLVRLLYCCVEGDEKLLIYEYLPNRSLDAFIFEYAMEGLFSVKSDVYSFGVLILEIAWNLWREGLAKDFVDSSVVESCSHEEVFHCIHTALLCVQDNPNARPLMSNIVSVLEGRRSTLLPTPEQPFYFAQRSKELQNSVDRKTITIVEGR
uniref:non-specific serine/threonine protein kinase n=1 Tax=Oryza punctata TaxID=4537 RepID=A0A0E0LYG7_ORYPU